jgi:2'-5' RNA ligase
MVKPERLRLFFALWPDPALRQALERLQAGLRAQTRARWVSPDQMHLTLAFPGEVALARLPEVMAIGQTLRAARFGLRLDRLECWCRAGVLCLTPTSTPAGLAELSQGLNLRLRAAGCTIEERPWRAHLTLARGLERPPAEDPPPAAIDWQVEAFSLVASRRTGTGSRYTVLQTWPLAGAAASTGPP